MGVNLLPQSPDDFWGKQPQCEGCGWRLCYLDRTYDECGICGTPIPQEIQTEHPRTIVQLAIMNRIFWNEPDEMMRELNEAFKKFADEIKKAFKF